MTKKIIKSDTTNEAGTREITKEVITHGVYRGVDFDLKTISNQIIRANGVMSGYNLCGARIAYTQDYTNYSNKREATRMIKLIIDDKLEYGGL